MQPNTCLVIDIWEGQLQLDEVVLKQNGVEGVSIRINNMNGGNHPDTMFTQYWNQFKDFVRFPYFVFNPWVSGTDNFNWLKSNMPSDAKSLALDVEVRYSGITPAKYAGEINIFLDLCKQQGWKTIIYTGQGYLDLLSKWPQMDYWWAMYCSPSYYFPNVKTWDDLKLALDKLTVPFNSNVIPGNLKLWQFSGDYLVLPGSTRDMDVSIFYGTKDDLVNYFGGVSSQPTPNPDPIPSTIIGTGIVKNAILNRRIGPGQTYATIDPQLHAGDKINVYEIQMDNNTNTWYRIDSTTQIWVCGTYQGTNYVDYSPVNVVPQSPKWYRIKDDNESPSTRPFNRGNQGLPSTVRYRGGDGQLQLSDAWMQYEYAINPSKQTQSYIFKAASGWQNKPTTGLVEQLTFSGNIVLVDKIENGNAYIRHYNLNDAPPQPVIPNIKTITNFPAVQLQTTQYTTYVDLSSDGRWPWIVIMSKNGEQLYMDENDLAPYNPVDMTVKVTASPYLNIRLSPYVSNKSGGTISYGQSVQIYATTTDNSGNIWGRLDLQSWIALYYKGQYFTTWRP